MEDKENSSQLIIRHDMVDQVCPRCPYGTLTESGLYDDVDQLVVCDVCRLAVHRWKSKRELAEMWAKYYDENEIVLV